MTTPVEIALQHSVNSPFEKALSLAARVAASNINALVAGEAGVGASALARHIHALSDRAEQPLVTVRCEGASEAALHRALFGDDCDLRFRTGLFAAAQGSTLVIEEIGEMPQNLQAMFMNALCTTGSAHPVFGPRAARLIATTSRGVRELGAGNTLRRDLADVFACEIEVPPLRSRAADVRLIARACWESLGIGRELTDDALEFLARQSWSGNARELEAFVVRLASSCTADAVGALDVARVLRPSRRKDHEDPVEMVVQDSVPLVTLEATSVIEQVRSVGLQPFLHQVEDAVIDWALAQAAGSRQRAANLLGMKRTTLVEKLRRRDPRQEWESKTVAAL